jgi:hypothetical protein
MIGRRLQRHKAAPPASTNMPGRRPAEVMAHRSTGKYDYKRTRPTRGGEGGRRQGNGRSAPIRPLETARGPHGRVLTTETPTSKVFHRKEIGEFRINWVTSRVNCSEQDTAIVHHSHTTTPGTGGYLGPHKGQTEAQRPGRKDDADLAQHYYKANTTSPRTPAETAAHRGTRLRTTPWRQRRRWNQWTRRRWEERC